MQKQTLENQSHITFILSDVPRFTLPNISLQRGWPFVLFVSFTFPAGHMLCGVWVLERVHGPIRKGQRHRREDNNSFHFIQTNKLFRNEIESDLQRQRRRITASFIPCRRILKCDLKTNKILEIKLFQFTKESDLQRQIQAWQWRLSSLGGFKNTF